MPLFSFELVSQTASRRLSLEIGRRAHNTSLRITCSIQTRDALQVAGVDEAERALYPKDNALWLAAQMRAEVWIHPENTLEVL
jgi:hypothetical protein